MTDKTEISYTVQEIIDNNGKMILVKIYPANREFFIQLKTFCREILDMCKELGIIPITYGSLAYFGYTKSKNITIKDIDFLIPEDSFEKIIKILKNKKIKYNYSTKWHTLQIFKNDLKIELDSIDYWQKDLPQDFEEFNFDGLTINVVSLNSLINIYKKASEVSKDKPKENLKKFKALKNLI